jgi:hypothetical protein
MVASPKGLEPEKDCASKGQQYRQKTDPSSRQRGRPTKTKPQVSNSSKYLVMSPHGARHQDLLTGRQSQCDFDFDSSVSAVQCSGMDRVGWWEWVIGVLQFSPCQLLLLEAGSWGTGIVREPRVRGTSSLGSRYQTTTGEGAADWRNFVRDVMNCKM